MENQTVCLMFFFSVWLTVIEYLSDHLRPCIHISLAVLCFACVNASMCEKFNLYASRTIEKKKLKKLN